MTKGTEILRKGSGQQKEGDINYGTVFAHPVKREEIRKLHTKYIDYIQPKIKEYVCNVM